MAVLSVTNLSVVKRDRLLFENLNFAVEQGALLYVKGQNGAGKTSSFYMIVGLVHASAGEISIDGQSVTHMPIHRIPRCKNTLWMWNAVQDGSEPEP